jgi:hypothetical protein
MAFEINKRGAIERIKAKGVCS